MLDDTLKASIREAYQTLVTKRQLKPRWGQRQMIAEVANALGDPDAPQPIAVVEAGTGTGKTIAYTVAACGQGPAQDTCHRYCDGGAAGAAFIPGPAGYPDPQWPRLYGQPG
ncbi:MAG: hypothetical protein ACPGPG_00145 [Luminiphilus sp.]